LQDHPGVWEKSEQSALEVVLMAFFYDPLQNFPMTDMNAVERSNGYYTGSRFVVIGKTLNG